MWPSLLRNLLKCSPNLLFREQPLLPVLDVTSMGWARTHPSQGSTNAAEEDPWLILQLNTEGLTASKISVIKQLAYEGQSTLRSC